MEQSHFSSRASKTRRGFPRIDRRRHMICAATYSLEYRLTQKAKESGARARVELKDVLSQLRENRTASLYHLVGFHLAGLPHSRPALSR